MTGFLQRILFFSLALNTVLEFHHADLFSSFVSISPGFSVRLVRFGMMQVPQTERAGATHVPADGVARDYAGQLRPASRPWPAVRSLNAPPSLDRCPSEKIICLLNFYSFTFSASPSPPSFLF
jgi:hypothetical protein